MKDDDYRVMLTPERAEACAKVTKQLVTMVCDELCTQLDKEVATAYEEGGQSVKMPRKMEPHMDELLASLDSVTLESHRKPSVVLLISYIIKTHTFPNEMQELVEGIMLALGVSGQVIGVDSVVSEIADQFDI